MAAERSRPRLYLIDAHSLIFQVFHAIPEMSSPSGLPTNALYGFTRDLLFLRYDVKPDYLVCAFDVSGPTFRDELYAEYKAGRAPMPDNLQLQLPLIHQMLEAMRIPVASMSGYEADDVIATVAVAAAARDIDVFICTSDKDCRQLIGDRICLYNLRKRERLDRAGLLRDWEIAPEQVVDLQALVGDSVDNVPGVRGIGHKTAARLLQQYGSLDGILANIETLAANGIRKGAWLNNLREAIGPKLELSRKLVKLAIDVPIEINWEKWKLQPPDVPRLLALFQEWDFRRFADQVREEERPRTPQQGTFFADEESAAETADIQAGPVEVKIPGKIGYRLVNTPDHFEAFHCLLTAQKRFAIDLETTDLDPLRADIVGMAFSWQLGEAWYLAFRGPEGEPVLDLKQHLPALRKVLENPAVAKVNQNIKYDMLALHRHGIRLAGLAGDPMVADYLLHAGERAHNLEDLANRYLDHRVVPITALIGKRGKKQLRMDQVPTAKVAEYAGEDADVALRLADLLEAQLAREGLERLYREVEVPLIHVLMEMEANGVRLDVPYLRVLSKDMDQQLTAIEGKIYELAGRRFNIASPKQLRTILFDELKLPTQRKTGITGEASTNQVTLERLAALGHPLPRLILEQRQIAKLKGTYVDALPDLVNPATGRVHASFNQTVASTGRLSSSDPNLQNIPIRTEQGRQIRKAFLPQEGWTLLTADYSQVELRLLAHFCGDEGMRRAFSEDRDIHASVAAQIFGMPEAEVTSEMRRTAKTVNFGVIYGISPVGLGGRLGMPVDEAAKFIDAYFSRYPRVAAYQANLLENCRQTGYVATILGRRRHITGIRRHTSYQQRNQPEREAVNMEIQGSAADLIKMAMLNISRRLREDRRQSRMLLQIHDELVFECPPDELTEVAQMVNHEMTTALELEVPLKVDMAAGPNWLDEEELSVHGSVAEVH